MLGEHKVRPQMLGDYYPHRGSLRDVRTTVARVYLSRTRRVAPQVGRGRGLIRGHRRDTVERACGRKS